MENARTREAAVTLAPLAFKTWYDVRWKTLGKVLNLRYVTSYLH